MHYRARPLLASKTRWLTTMPSRTTVGVVSLDASAPAPEDAGHELMDMDKLEQQEGGMQIIAKSRLKRVKDWRVKKVSWISAFFSKSLRPNDMQFIYSLLAAFVAWVIATIIMKSTSETAA